MDPIDVIDAEFMISKGGDCLIEATPIVAAGSVIRRPPTFINSAAVPSELRARLEATFAQKQSSYPALYMLSLTDPFVVGQGSVVVRFGNRYRLLKESVREFLAQKLVPDGFHLAADGQFSMPESIQRRLEERCLLLQRPWSNNFGHWLVDQAMALSYLSRVGALKTNGIVVAKVRSPRLREIMFQTIAAILPCAEIHEHPDAEVWQFRHLDYMMPMHVPPLFKLPAALDCLRDDLLKMPAEEFPKPRRFHVVRQGGIRKLQNEAEIMALSANFGFEAVHPETLSIVEQAKLFRGAEAILGVKGAAMTNILFSDPACRVMVMSPSSFIDPFFWDIASTRGISYSETFGEITTTRASLGHNDFLVNPTEIEEMLRKVLSS
jgi:capsular polysaccharide biosynthesis protein